MSTKRRASQLAIDRATEASHRERVVRCSRCGGETTTRRPGLGVNYCSDCRAAVKRERAAIRRKGEKKPPHEDRRRRGVRENLALADIKSGCEHCKFLADCNYLVRVRGEDPYCFACSRRHYLWLNHREAKRANAID